MTWVDDLVLLAIVIAIASIIIVAFLYIWALRRQREMETSDVEDGLGEGPWDIP